MAHQYTALIRKEPTTDYWVDCPDILGCISGGKTIEEAKKHFAELLKFHLEGIKERDKNYRLPSPRSREEVLAAEEDDYLSPPIRSKSRSLPDQSMAQ